jgi:predicted ATP-binding protein involved in virulence
VRFLNGDLIFKDSNNTLVSIKDMSDGFRSILSITLELIRQLILTYSAEVVFPLKDANQATIQIKLPGVVLIDEIDVHLHPTWQTKIGKWFTQVFPNIQFIVATHSPFVCRACQNGSIWRLATPNTKMRAGEIKGIERDRLIYGNILDAQSLDLVKNSVNN